MLKFNCLKGRDKWFFLLTLGIVLCILAFPADRLSGKRGVLSESREEENGISYMTQEERRVKAILEHVEGIGTVEVMIVPNTGAQRTGSSALFAGGTEEVQPQIAGIIICADGGGRPAVQEQICRAMEALYGLPAHKIGVLKRVE